MTHGHINGELLLPPRARRKAVAGRARKCQFAPAVLVLFTRILQHLRQRVSKGDP